MSAAEQAQLEAVDKLAPIAKELDCSLAQVGAQTAPWPAGDSLFGMMHRQHRLPCMHAALGVLPVLARSDLAQCLVCADLCACPAPAVVLQLALAWCAKNPRVSTVITGATRVEQIVENMKAVAVLPKLTDEVMQRIHDITDAAEVV